MRKGLIQYLVMSLAMGVYLFYNEPILEFVQNFLPIETSPYLYAGVGLVILFIAAIIGKSLTRGMK